MNIKFSKMLGWWALICSIAISNSALAGQGEVEFKCQDLAGLSLVTLNIIKKGVTFEQYIAKMEEFIKYHPEFPGKAYKQEAINVIKFTYENHNKLSPKDLADKMYQQCIGNNAYL